MTEPKMMKAAVYTRPKEIVVKQVPYPVPGPREVVVKVAYSGICGTDYQIVKGDYVSPYPLIGGHEFSGEIFEIGIDVKNWGIGDRVIVAPSVYCGNCYYCQNDQFNHCENIGSLGVIADGGFAEFVKVPIDNLFRLEDSLTFEEGALVEPMACVAYALDRLKSKFGDKVLIFGAGPMGIMLLQALNSMGASEVLVVDVAKEKLDMAIDYGATSVHLNDENLVRQIGTEKYPKGFQLVIDTTGVTNVIEGMFSYAGKGASILQFGVPDNKSEIKINPFEIYHNDWNYIGTMAYKLNFYQAINMIKGKKVEVNSMVTKIISLEEFASYMLKKKEPLDLKVLVDPSL